MNLYYVEYEHGCGIKAANSVEHARQQVREDLRSRAWRITARKAEDEDIEWVSSMGGYVPELEEYTKAC